MASGRGTISRKEAWLSGLGCLAGVVIVIAVIVDSSWGHSHLESPVLSIVFTAAIVLWTAAVIGGLWFISGLKLIDFIWVVPFAVVLTQGAKLSWLLSTILIVIPFTAITIFRATRDRHGKDSQTGSPAQAVTDDHSPADGDVL